MFSCHIQICHIYQTIKTHILAQFNKPYGNANPTYVHLTRILGRSTVKLALSAWNKSQQQWNVTNWRVKGA